MNVIYRMFIYDFMYIMGDQLIKKYNPCQIQTSESGEVTCLGDNGPCCTDCEYLSDSGCTVTCLGCKLGLCSTAIDIYPELTNKLRSMRYRLSSHTYGMCYIRTSRSNVYSGLKMMRDNIKRRKKWQLDTLQVKKKK